MLKSAYAGGIDTVGGIILENIIKSTSPLGAVICCGNVASSKLDLTIFPFILRGISLIGISSQNSPMICRKKVWDLLAKDWKPDHLSDTCIEITLEELSEKIELILKGKLKGRTVLNMEV
jgi:NADPH:quinone reductase-like Zn-dependent oxidoreductase